MPANAQPDIQERKRQLAVFLQDALMEYQRNAIKQGRRKPPQSDFVRWLGVHPTNYSGWITEDRLPTGDNVDILATKLGQTIYDIVGVPPRMPKDKKLALIARRWHLLNDQQRSALAEEVQNLTDDLNVNSKIPELS